MGPLALDRAAGEDRKEGPVFSRKDGRRAVAELRQRTQGLRAAVRQAERELARLTGERAEIDRRLADPRQYAGIGGVAALTALRKSKSVLERAVAAAEAGWLAAAEALERAESGGP